MSRFLSENNQGLKAYVPGEQPKLKNLVKLNTNESPFPPAPGVAEAVQQAADSLQLYNDLSAAKLTGLLTKTYGVKENQVFVGNGSDEVLAFAFQVSGAAGWLSRISPTAAISCGRVYFIWTRKSFL